MKVNKKKRWGNGTFGTKKSIGRTVPLTLSLAFILSGCGGYSTPDVSETPRELQQTVAIKGQADEYSLYYEQEYSLSLYEPETGCYLGAYVLSNRDINFDIGKFDEMTGKEHAISVYNLNAGNQFPELWVISCIAAKKTPYFVLLPPNEYNPYDYSFIDSLAESFGEFYIPMYVELYPIAGPSFNPKAYIDFFQYARRRFKEKASNIAFVWAVDVKYVSESTRYYPGDVYVDWVGLHSIQPLFGDGYGADLFNEVDYFYYMYQKVKPIAISEFAVSHFTNTDYIYKNHIASDEIIRVYNKIINYYPRIKMINYMDYDEKINDLRKKSDYYTVTENDIALSAYKESISDNRFLSSIVLGDESQEVIQQMRSPFPAQKIGEYWYVSEYSFTYDLNTKGALGERLIDGRKYYNVNIFAKNARRDITADEETRKLILSG